MGALCVLTVHLQAPADTYSARVVGVSDGDTVTVLDTSMVMHKVRLSGIDAPEKRQPFGHRSKESLSDLVFDRWVSVKTDKRDLELTRFSGHIMLCVQGVEDVQSQTAVPGGIPSTDC